MGCTISFRGVPGSTGRETFSSLSQRPCPDPFDCRMISRLKVAADIWAVVWSKVASGVVPAVVVGSILYIKSRL